MITCTIDNWTIFKTFQNVLTHTYLIISYIQHYLNKSIKLNMYGFCCARPWRTKYAHRKYISDSYICTSTASSNWVNWISLPYNNLHTLSTDVFHYEFTMIWQTYIYRLLRHKTEISVNTTDNFSICLKEKLWKIYCLLLKNQNTHTEYSNFETVLFPNKMYTFPDYY